MKKLLYTLVVAFILTNAPLRAHGGGGAFAAGFLGGAALGGLGGYYGGYYGYPYGGYYYGPGCE